MTHLSGPRLVSAMVASACLIAGCQGPTVKLSDGRKVTLGDIEREMTKAYEQMGKTSARITAREWEYHDEMLLSRGLAGQGQDPVLSTHARNLAAYQDCERRDFFDATTVRQATLTRELRDLPALHRLHGLNEKAAEQAPKQGFSLMQWKQNGEMLSAAGCSLAITLSRMEAGTTAKPPQEPMTYGLHSISFLVRARRGGGTMEVVHEDGLELMKVSLRLPNTTTTGWFRPDMGYRVHRIEERDPWDGNKLASTIKASDYRVINGVPYPFKYEVILFDSPGHRQVSFQMRVETMQAEFGVELRDEDFELEVPKGIQLVSIHKDSKNRSCGWFAFGGGTVTVSAVHQPTAASRPAETVRVDVNRLFEMANAAPTKTSGGGSCRPKGAKVLD